MTLDLLLPGDDGMVFFRSLRSDEKYRHLPVVIVSIKVEQARKELGGPSGGVLDWVQKPIDPDGLLKAVKWAAGGRKDHKPRILHVEDDADVAQVVAGITAGVASVDRADTLEAAKRMLEAGSYDLVILDLDLPDGSGGDLLPLLSSGTPAVIFAAADPPGDRPHAASRPPSLGKDPRLEPDPPGDNPPGAGRFGTPQAAAADGGMTVPGGDAAPSCPRADTALYTEVSSQCDPRPVTSRRVIFTMSASSRSRP